ncbi:MAG: hypothetical protein WCL14_08815 [Bacteroidota bacterium]
MIFKLNKIQNQSLQATLGNKSLHSHSVSSAHHFLFIGTPYIYAWSAGKKDSFSSKLQSPNASTLVEKSTAPVEKKSALVEKSSALVEKSSAPVEKSSAPVERSSALVEKSSALPQNRPFQAKNYELTIEINKINN